MPCSTVLKPGLVERYSSALLEWAGPAMPSWATENTNKHRSENTPLEKVVVPVGPLWFLWVGSLQRLAVPDWNHWQWLCIRSGHWLQWASGRGQHRRWPLWNQSRWGAKLSAKFPRIPRFPRIHVGKEFSCWKSQNFQTSPSVQVGQTGFLRGSATLAQF